MSDNNRIRIDKWLQVVVGGCGWRASSRHAVWLMPSIRIAACQSIQKFITAGNGITNKSRIAPGTPQRDDAVDILNGFPQPMIFQAQTATYDAIGGFLWCQCNGMRNRLNGGFRVAGRFFCLSQKAEAGGILGIAPGKIRGCGDCRSKSAFCDQGSNMVFDEVHRFNVQPVGHPKYV